MPLRDDHEAALARAEALERELKQERAKDAEDAARVERLQAEVAEAKERLARAEAELAEIKPAKPRPEPELRGGRIIDTPPPPKQRTDRMIRAMIAGSAVLMVVLALGTKQCIERRRERGAYSAQERRPPPTPPFVAAPLVAEGLAALPGDLRVRSIEVEYVDARGELDPTHGRIEIETERPPPPPPPDDPGRPTGAPAPTHARAMPGLGSCPTPRWTPGDGWRSDPGGCFGIGETPAARPRCSVAAINAHARQESAPDGLARIEAKWTMRIDGGDIGWGWVWTFSIDDAPRDVHFRREIADADCPDTAAERPTTPP